MLALRIGLLVFGLSQALANDLCNIPECNGTEHLGCNNDLTFHSSCMRRHNLVNMQIYEDYLVKIHNKYRNDVASGAFPAVPTAKQMPEMLWHYKLALMAQYHVKRCLRTLNYCVSLTNFTEPAINYGVTWVNIESKINYRSKMNSNKVTLQVDQWMQQVYKLTQTVQYSTEISDILNIVNDRNFYLGCAAAEDYDRRYSRFVLICYYDELYHWGNAVYQVGAFQPENCPLGRSDNYAYLCKPFKNLEH